MDEIANVDTSIQGTSGSVDIVTPITTPTEMSGSFDFREHLSDEFKNHKSLEQYKDLNGLAKSHIELEKTLGNRIKVPDENATPDELNKFYTKLGRPETSDKYELTNPEKLPDGFAIDEAGVKEFKELAYKLGLSNKQANELRSVYVNKAMEAHQKSFVPKEQQEEQFKTKGLEMFGEKYDSILQNASKMITENLSPEQKQALDNLDNDSLLTVASLLNNIQSKYLKPDSIDNNYSPASTSESMKKELIELVDKRSKMNVFNPEYESTDKKIKELYAKGIKIF